MIKNINSKNINFFIISILFVPGFFIFSRFLLDLYISTLAIICLIFIYQKKIKIIDNKIVILFFIFYVYLIFNSLFSFSLEISLYKTLPYIRLIMFSIFFAYIISKYRSNIIIPLIYSFIFFHTILFIGSIYELFLGKNVFNFPTINGRISSFFGDELILGSYTSKVIPIIFTLIFLVREKIPKKIDLYLISISTVMIILSAERTALFQFVLFITLFILVSYSRIEKLKIYFICLSVTCIIFLINPNSYSRLIKHTYNQITVSQNIFAPSFRHSLHYETAVKMFLDKKFLGQGFKSFRYLCDNEKFIPMSTILEHSGNHVLSPENGIFTIEPPSRIGKKDALILYYLDSDNLKKSKIFKRKTYQFSILDNNSYVKKGDLLFVNTYYKDGCNTHPHNFYLQILSEIGFLGFIFIIIFYFYICFKFSYKIIKSFKKTKLKSFEISYLILFLGLITFLVPFFPGGNFFNNWISIFLYLYIGLLFYFSSEKRI
tara:strand:- start:1696 stop:3162 length:1467 start_codon:yes stop_codon:yes gene_type:complete